LTYGSVLSKRLERLYLNEKTRDSFYCKIGVYAFKKEYGGETWIGRREFMTLFQKLRMNWFRTSKRKGHYIRILPFQRTPVPSLMEVIYDRIQPEIHRKLVAGVRGGKADPGSYRRTQNYVANSQTGEVIYTPPSAVEIPIMMSEMVKWLNSDIEIHPVLISGIAQFQLVHIHPFLDGNGRTSRLLSTLCLYKAGYDFKRLFTISEYYDRDRPTFYKKIQSVRDNDMDMTGWLEYFITGLQIQMVEVKERGEQVIRRDVLTQKHNLNERQAKAIEYLLQYGKLTIQDYEVLCPEVKRRSLQRDLKILIEKELLASEGATNQLVYFLRI